MTLSWLVEESTGGRGLARFKLKTWQCDELFARRSNSKGPVICKFENLFICACETMRWSSTSKSCTFILRSESPERTFGQAVQPQF